MSAFNRADYASHAVFYARAFGGIRHDGPIARGYDREAWLADRRSRIQPAATLDLKDVHIEALGTDARLSLAYRFSFAVGPDESGWAQIILGKEEGKPRILREETWPNSAGPTAGSGEPPALFAVLFDPGRTWKYLTTKRIVHGGNKTEVKRATECHIQNVVATVGCWSSEITCTGNGLEQPASRAWLATPQGLFEANDACPDDGSALPDLGEPLLDAVPAVREQRRNDGEAVVLERTTHPGREWCHESVESQGDEGTAVVCVEAGVGLTRALSGTAGASLYETEMILQRDGR